MNLLGGMESDANEKGRKEIERQEKEEELGEKEIGEAVMRIKQKKTAGIDKIPVKA